jgi:hypothetical protein
MPAAYPGIRECHGIADAAMYVYYVNRNAQPNGDHEVHRSDCPFVPFNRQELGYHLHCPSAVVAAKRHFAQSNGCYWCSKPCHRA